MNDVRTYSTPEQLAEAAAAALLDLLADEQAAGKVPHIALTGGTIAEAIHAEVARQAPASGVDWGAVDIWFGDERFVAADSPDRNALQARRAFLDEVGAHRVHEMPASGDVPSVDAGAEAYAEELRASGGGEFDVVMLGIGPDGHVASLFPRHPQLDVTDAIAVGVTDSPKPPPERISLTFEALSRARQVWFFVSGDGKADALARALAPEGDVHETPARGVHGREATVWFTDEAANQVL